MRKQLLLSTGIICLMLAPAVSYGQAPGARGEEQKQMRPSEGGKGAASQERGAERAQERGQGAEHKAQGAAGREERGSGSRQTEERGKAAPPSERNAAAGMCQPSHRFPRMREMKRRYLALLVLALLALAALGAVLRHRPF